MADSHEWLRGRGIGRERLAGHVGDFLQQNGYKVDRTDGSEPPESQIRADLLRMNPAVPESAKRLEFRLLPTSGGCSLAWIAPATVPVLDRSRVDRFVREMVQYVERAVSTESHGTAKVSRAPAAILPWESV